MESSVGKAPASQVLRFEFESPEPIESGTRKRLQMVAEKTLKVKGQLACVHREKQERLS